MAMRMDRGTKVSLVVRVSHDFQIPNQSQCFIPTAHIPDQPTGLEVDH